MPQMLSKLSMNGVMFLAAVCLLSGCMPPSEPDTKGSGEGTQPAYKQFWVTTKRLNRRTCPSPKCGSVGQLFFRESATVYEQKKGWGRISPYYDASCKNGRSEYVDSGNAACMRANGIETGKLAEWVAMSHLTTVRPADPAQKAGVEYTLVKDSDDFQEYKETFAKAAKSLIGEGSCQESDFQEMGGFTKSMQHKHEPVYFVYCGGMTLENRIYLNAVTGKTFK